MIAAFLVVPAVVFLHLLQAAWTIAVVEGLYQSGPDSFPVCPNQL